MHSIFVTGAAAGIGRAVVERFLGEGWLVGAYDLTDLELEHPNLTTGRLDVTDAGEWERALAEFAAAAGGRIDVVDNNAGVIIAGPVAEAEPEEIRRVIDINALGVTLGAWAAHPYLAASGGHLVNMASAAAIHGQPRLATYSASKSYVAGLTEALRLEWRGDGIRVVDIWPLWVRTSFAEGNAGRLGIRIIPQQVADVVWDAVHPPNRYARGRVHYGVSARDKLFYVASQWVPDRVRRFVTRLVAE